MKKSRPSKLISPSSATADCYDAPRYWDLAFSDETLFEADFIQAAALQYLGTDAPSTLEIGCGGGRQVIELARRGLAVSAFDLHPRCVKFTQHQLRRRRLSAEVFSADMTRFKLSQRFELAHCLVNTFRHLTSEAAAQSHVESVAACLKPGGIYLLGFHLLPPDTAEDDCERWTITQRGTRISTTIRVLDFNRRRRIETVRFSLKVTTPKRVIRFASDHQLRIYRADQFKSLLRSVPSLELMNVYDFCYDISEPLMLNDQLGDAVFVVRRK